jgi:twinkle protein
MNEEDMKVDSIIKSAKALVRQKGIKILVIDPYNKLEHQYSGRKTETQYISEFLDILTNFAKFNDVLIFLVAHPTKLQKDQEPNLYSISGSANFFNKCDYGITVHRPIENNLMTNEVKIFIQKVKFKNLGCQAQIELKYNYVNGRYETTLKDVNSWDYVNWLQPELKLENYQSIEQDYEYLQKDEIPF